MIELALIDTTNARYGCGGDTYNCAVYLRRQLGSEDDTLGETRVDYVTALGDDALSDEMLATWRDHQLHTDHVFRLPNHLPGLYMIKTTAEGERQFHYWRQQAAVRSLLHEGRDVTLARALIGFDLIYFSGITIAILDSRSRGSLYKLLERLRQNGRTKIAFDPNYRGQLWSPDEADEAYRTFGPLIDIALPGLADAQALDPKATTQTTLAYWRQIGVPQVVVKDSANPVLAMNEEHTVEVPPSPVEHVVDTTAAGDSFNAAYLAARLRGHGMQEAVAKGNALAAQVVQARGAIVDTTAQGS